jgi:hypothetical protein
MKKTKSIRWGKRRPRTPSTPIICNNNNDNNDISLWRDIALPLTRAIQYLHSQLVCYNTLSIDTVAFSSTSPEESNLLLVDFSKATKARQNEENDFSFDLLCLGRIFKELQQVQPQQQVLLQNLIDSCCHETPSCRPTIRRVYKRLLECIRLHQQLTTPPPPPPSSCSPTPEPPIRLKKQLSRLSFRGKKHLNESDGFIGKKKDWKKESNNSFRTEQTSLRTEDESSLAVSPLLIF